MNEEILKSNGRYKLFLVSEDDEDRERVISGIVEFVQIDIHNDLIKFYDNHYYDQTLEFNNFTGATMTLRLIPQGATFFKVEDFSGE